MQLTAYILSVTDGYFLVGAKEVPDLVAKVSSIRNIRDAVRSAAAALTGHAPNYFDVISDY